VPPDFRDGWNACYRLALTQPPTPQAPAPKPDQEAQQAAGSNDLSLTEAQLGKHVLRAGDCPPDSQVLLVSSIRRLQAKPQAPAVAAEYRWNEPGVQLVHAMLCTEQQDADPTSAACRIIEALKKAGWAAPAVAEQVAAWALGDPRYCHSSNILAAHEFTPDPERVDEWTPLYAAPFYATPQPPAQAPVAIAEVTWSDPLNLTARIQWLLNPMPVGSVLYEVARPQMSADGGKDIPFIAAPKEKPL
jgi:hypothetical protein